MNAEYSPAIQRPYAQVDHARCMGVSLCILAAPASFGLNGRGLSEFQPHDDVTLPELEEAALACPMAAITIHWK